jgi:hypothetical protein
MTDSLDAVHLVHGTTKLTAYEWQTSNANVMQAFASLPANSVFWTRRTTFYPLVK